MTEAGVGMKEVNTPDITLSSTFWLFYIVPIFLNVIYRLNKKPF